MASLSLKALRTVAMYTGLSLAVTVGGVAIGALIVAPAVSRARPLLQRAMATESGANAPAVSGVAAFKANISNLGERAGRSAQAIPREQWAAVLAGGLVLVGGLLYRRRRAGALVKAPATVRMPAITPSKPTAGKISGTPRAVVALAESGASMADIARRTRMPLDAVAMCLSMGSFGARQLRPPTA